MRYDKDINYVLVQRAAISIHKTNGKKYDKPTKLNSYDVVRKIKELQRYNKPNLIKEVFKIYNNLTATQKNEEMVINEVLNCSKKSVHKSKMDVISVGIMMQCFIDNHYRRVR